MLRRLLVFLWLFLIVLILWITFSLDCFISVPNLFLGLGDILFHLFDSHADKVAQLFEDFSIQLLEINLVSFIISRSVPFVSVANFNDIAEIALRKSPYFL